MGPRTISGDQPLVQGRGAALQRDSDSRCRISPAGRCRRQTAAAASRSRPRGGAEFCWDFFMFLPSPQNRLDCSGSGPTSSKSVTDPAAVTGAGCGYWTGCALPGGGRPGSSFRQGRGGRVELRRYRPGRVGPGRGELCDLRDSGVRDRGPCGTSRNPSPSSRSGRSDAVWSPQACM